MECAMKLLDELEKGWSFASTERCLLKFHYVKNGISLCGKHHFAPSKSRMPTSMLSKNEMCSKCLAKLKEIKE